MQKDHWWLNFRYSLLEGTEEKHNNSQLLGQDLNVKCLEYTAWVLSTHPWSLGDENNINLKREIFVYFNVSIQFKNYVAGHLCSEIGGKYAGTGWDRLICFLKYDFMILDGRLWQVKLHSWWYPKCMWEILVSFQVQMFSLSLSYL